MKRSISPIYWLLFGAGGMLSALFGPALILITGFMAPLHKPADFATYDTVLSFVRHPIGKMVVLAVIALFLWHGAERACLTLKDMRMGPLGVLKLATYGVAAVLSVVTALLLLVIGF